MAGEVPAPARPGPGGAAGRDGTENAHGLVDHLFRKRAGQMVAWLTRVFGAEHLELAEEVVQDALLKALQQWPHSGIPEHPDAWLWRVARNRALDVLRRHAAFRERTAEVVTELERRPPNDEAGTWAVEDDELRMVFMCCHPLLSRDARVALSLKTVGGLGVAEIARAFLAQEATIAQRLVRAKRQLREGGVGLELPRGADLAPRLDSVLEVIYLLFNEGYASHAGEDLVRRELCGEALRLGGLVARSPEVGEPRAHALVSLMAFQAARLPARVDAAGELVLLEDQDRSLWDNRLIALGFAHLERSAEGGSESAYHLQAAIAAVHAGAPAPAATRWADMLELYDRLLGLQPSPVVALNRAVALARARGARAGLEALAPLEDDPALSQYHLLPSVKGGLLLELGEREAAAACYRQALARPCTEPERRFLVRRLGVCGAG